MEEEAVSRNINLRSFKGQKPGRTSPVSDEKPKTSIETDEVFLSHHPPKLRKSKNQLAKFQRPKVWQNFSSFQS
ncbi:hypothetical protein [Pedobacter sp. R20-19]|uniref:hypothetical protein n=1 Tax=Pedobacter sp. R20-19 TaxID=1270196 RepID=UPI00056BC5B1|nr:hypothetical protein [Pedobacter sp. R20-19]